MDTLLFIGAALQFLNVVVASPISTSDVNSVSWLHVCGGVFSFLFIICFIKILTLCAEICQKKQVYKEFGETDEAFNPDLNPSSPVNPEFSMYPPTENTPDTIVNTTPVVFEPLPDISAIKSDIQVANAVQLRPKVAIVPSSHDGEDFEDVIRSHDPAQDKVKLQNLMSNARSQVPREQISYIKELGHGWFGKVLQAEGHSILPGHKKTKIVVEMLKEDGDTQDQLAFLQEAAPYREVEHNNVLKMLGQSVETRPFLTVLELCPFGDLKTYLRGHRVAMDSFNEKGLLLKFASDIAAGLQALHDVHFIHRDFAARNCLLASDLTVKIGDYGLAEETFKEDYYYDQTGCGLPLRWLAPECVLIQDNGDVGLQFINKPCNVWSFGVTLWEIITFGSLPYTDLSNQLVLRLVVKERSVQLPKPDVNVTHIDRLYELMLLCWSPSTSRPSLRQLRIMLLHLLSSKINAQNISVFEEKWNKLLPRRPAQRVSNTEGFANQSLSNGDVKTVNTQEVGGATPYSEPGSQQAVNRVGLSLEAELVQVHRKPADGESYSSPVNELSLAAELSGFTDHTVTSGDKSADHTVTSEDKSADHTVTSGDKSADHTVISGDNSADHTVTSGDVTQSDSLQDYKMDSLLSESLDSHCKDDDIVILDNHGDLVTTTPDLSTTHFMSPLTEVDFTTSTPRKGGEESMFQLPQSSMAGVGETPCNSQYVTALSTQVSTDSTALSTQVSTDSTVSASLTSTEEDRSFLGQKKFAAMLQTVVTSFDNEEEITPSSLGEMSFEAIPEEPELMDPSSKTGTQEAIQDTTVTALSTSTNQPTLVAETNQPAVLATETNQSVLVGTETNQPVLVETETNQPVLVGTETKQPVLVGTETKQPVLVETETNQPVLVETETNQPVLVETETKEPVLVETESKEPAVLGTETNQPAVLGTETKQPAVLGTETNQPIVIGEAESSQLWVDKSPGSMQSEITDVDRGETPETLSTETNLSLLDTDSGLSESSQSPAKHLSHQGQGLLTDHGEPSET